MDKNGIVHKCLFSNTEEGTQTEIRLRYNPKTDHIGIYRQFQKQYGWSGIINNKNCSNYLGITVAEQVLFNIFNHVERMPPHNKGFDFICGKGFMIDVKSSTKTKRDNAWFFNINKNLVADYFLCLAFDDRKNLNPKHIWLIPSKRINHLIGFQISESKVDKWSKYELTDKLDKVIGCCNIMRDN